MTELYKESPQSLYNFVVNNRDSFKEYDENDFRYFYHRCQEKLYRATDLGTEHLLEMLNAYGKEGLPVIDLLLIVLWFNGLNVSLSGKPLRKALLNHFSDNDNVILADKKVHEALMEENVKIRKREYAIIHGRPRTVHGCKGGKMKQADEYNCKHIDEVYKAFCEYQILQQVNTVPEHNEFHVMAIDDTYEFIEIPLINDDLNSQVRSLLTNRMEYLESLANKHGYTFKEVTE